MTVVTPYRKLAYLGAKVQSGGQGVSAGAPLKYFILNDQAFKPSQKVNKFRAGNTRDIVTADKQEFVYAGMFKTPLYADEGAFLMAMSLGADALTNPATGVYQHALTLTDNLPYGTWEAAFYENQIIDRVIDVKVAKLLIEAEAQKDVMLSGSLMGCSVAQQGSAQTPSFSNGAGEGPMKFSDGVFTLTGPSDGAQAAATVQKFSIEVDQDMNAIPGPGQHNPIGLHEQSRLVTFKATLLFTSKAFYNLIHYGSSTGTAQSSVVGTGSFAATFTSQAASPGPERSALLNMPLINWESGDPSMNPDGKTGTIDVMGTGYRSGATMPINATFKNAYNAAYV